MLYITSNLKNMGRWSKHRRPVFSIIVMSKEHNPALVWHLDNGRLPSEGPEVLDVPAIGQINGKPIKNPIGRPSSRLNNPQRRKASAPQGELTSTTINPMNSFPSISVPNQGLNFQRKLQSPPSPRPPLFSQFKSLSPTTPPAVPTITPEPNPFNLFGNSQINISAVTDKLFCPIETDDPFHNFDQLYELNSPTQEPDFGNIFGELEEYQEREEESDFY